MTGSEVVNSDGSVTVTASWKRPQPGRSDAHHHRAREGDFQISVQDISETEGNLTGYAQPQVGIIIRQSAALGRTVLHGAAGSARTRPRTRTSPTSSSTTATTWSGPVVELTQNYPLAFPRYIMVQRHGDTFQTLFSSDGTNYTLISATVHTIVMPTTLMAGVGIASGTPTATTTAVYKPRRGAADADVPPAERAPRVPHRLELHGRRRRFADRR